MNSSKKPPIKHRNRIVLSSSADEEDNNTGPRRIQCTPPKMKKFEPRVELSPRTLFERLSIDQKPEDEDSSSDLEVTPLKETHKATKYQNARQVLNSSATNNLPGRELEYKELYELIRKCGEDKRSSSMYISGQPGTGKTATLTKLLNSAVVSNFNKVYVNCTGISSIGAIYKKIAEELKLNLKSKTEKECLSAIEKYMTSTKHKMVLLVLDEIDQLMNKKQTILYTIFEWPAKFGKIVLIGIANALDLTDRMLSRLHSACELKPKLMHFPPYTKQQICDIFNDRLRTAGVMDIFPAITIQLLAAKVAAVSGDVRRALDIGRRVIEIAEQQKGSKKEIDINKLESLANDEDSIGSCRPVQVTQIVSVLSNVYGASQTLNDDIDDGFPLQQKILICTLLMMLKNEKNKDVTMGRLHDVYRRVCTKRNINAVDQVEFCSLSELAETRGILKLTKKKEPRLTKIRLQWDEDEVRNALKDKQLIASILGDSGYVQR